MARSKKTSPTLESAQTRLAALNSIDPKQNLGTGLGIDDYSAKITSTASASLLTTLCSRRWTGLITTAWLRKRACMT